MGTPTTSVIPPSLLIMKGAVPDYKATALSLQSLLQASEDSNRGFAKINEEQERAFSVERNRLLNALTKTDATLDRYLNAGFWARLKYLFTASL